LRQALAPFAVTLEAEAAPEPTPRERA
jgi:hypothetical protein